MRERRGMAGAGWIPESYLGLVLGFAVLLLDPLLEYLLARGLRARVTGLDVGFGPVVRRRPGAARVIEIRAIPLRIQAKYLPRREHYARDKRLLMSSGLVCPLLLVAVLTPFVPGRTALALLLFVLVCVVMRALAKEKLTGRRVILRILRKVSPDRDPELFEPRFPDFTHTYYAIFYGDLARAEALLPTVRANQWPVDCAKLIDEAVHEVRGEYDAALAVVAGYDESKRMLADLEKVRLALHIAELLPESREQAVLLAGAFLREQTHVADRNTFAAMLALFRLETGQPDLARRSTERYLANVGTPLEIADALCTRARIEAALGRGDRAARALREAQRFAPWYARVSIVRARLGIDSVDTPGDLNVAQPRDRASRDTLDDPWAAPRR
jgi:hypothetical protein